MEVDYYDEEGKDNSDDEDVVEVDRKTFEKIRLQLEADSSEKSNINDL
eukprot:CAMPEP_0116872374 /NCGR_PEP_ID=MMETSP0463-20121206/3116_1 /TAXON_ID=181622 /ORGANISM="Strombidinopsis sp, Strain SopsisLIS2011" /LENGTH=47 /DNA_ID= /DNA_START= /DNA_END= /DNA_ORIENTATION=